MKWYIYSKLPPPNTGQTIGSKALVNGLISQGINPKIIDISSKDLVATGVFSNFRKLENLYHRILGLFKIDFFSKKCIIYYIPSNSFIPSLIDYLLTLARGRKIAHLRTSGLDKMSGYSKWIYFKGLKRCHKVIVFSKNLASELPRNIKLEIIPNFIDVDLSEIQQVGKIYNFVYVSTFIRSKGVLDIVEAVRILKGRSIEVSVDFFGPIKDNNLFKMFNDKIIALGLERNITYHGPIMNTENVLLTLKKSKFLILPTYYEYEAMPRIIMEAMCVGLPIITTNHAGIPDMVNDEFSEIANKQDSNDLAIKMKRIMGRNYELLSQKAKDHFISNFDKEEIIKKIIRCVE